MGVTFLVTCGRHNLAVDFGSSRSQNLSSRSSEIALEYKRDFMLGTVNLTKDPCVRSLKKPPSVVVKLPSKYLCVYLQISGASTYTLVECLPVHQWNIYLQISVASTCRLVQRLPVDQCSVYSQISGESTCTLVESLPVDQCSIYLQISVMSTQRLVATCRLVQLLALFRETSLYCGSS